MTLSCICADPVRSGPELARSEKGLNRIYLESPRDFEKSPDHFRIDFLSFTLGIRMSLGGKLLEIAIAPAM